MPSGTHGFNIALNELVEEAFDRCGLVVRNARDYRSARRSLDLLLAEWANEGTNMFLLQEGSTTLSSGQSTFTMPGEVQDIIEIYSRENLGTSQQNDLPIRRVGVSDWSSLPNKNQSAGRPTNVYVQKARDAIVLHFWPTPNRDTVVAWWELIRPEDSGTDGSDTVDVAYRFLPALTAGLALKIAEKQAPDRLAYLQTVYRDAWDKAVASDRERRPTRLHPGLSAYRR